ncbi:MAG: carbon storage regulator [Planctomyces sp.]|jgi:carbon storage regulator CsrA|nr:carbon storage regulator [Planctomyces sp.]HAV30376.1 carbon storage regulator [Planctomycetaceae bacterium]HBC61242.1 carbon storage regulator [Planctomycetaceae bacterium]
MLVLTRRTSETIRIGDNIVIRVNRVGRQQVSLGIEAPPDVSVLRGELKRMPDGATGNPPVAASLVPLAPEQFRVSA